MSGKTVTFATQIAQFVPVKVYQPNQKPSVGLTVPSIKRGTGDFAPRKIPALNVSTENLLHEQEVCGADILLVESAISNPVAHADEPAHFNSFGIPPEKLNEQGDSTLQFERYRAKTAQRRDEKLAKRSFTGKKVYKETIAEGKDPVLERCKERVGAKYEALQNDAGKKVQTGLNKVGRVLREQTGRPRKTGGNYGTDKPKDDPLTSGKQLPNDYVAAAVAGTRALSQGPSGYAALNDPTLLSHMAPMADGIATVALLSSSLETVFAVGAQAKIISEKEKAKNDLNFTEAASRFNSERQNASAEDSLGFLKFLEAGDKVFGATQENVSIEKAATYRTARSVGTAVTNAVSAGIEVANTVVSVTPFASVAVAPATAALGVVEICEGREELLRRVDQKAQAATCKARMAELRTKLHANESFKKHPDFALVEGLIACFDVQQDRAIRQARREKKFARLRIFKGGGTVGGVLGVVAAVGALAGVGALTFATAGAAAVPLTGLAAAWGISAAARNHKRVRAEHNAKSRQRMVRALALHTPRKVLEAKLAGLPEDSLIEFEQEEGEYLAETGHFAGKRVLKLKARNNEFLGLEVLALKVQDMIQTKTYDETSPCIQLIHAIGIDPLHLLAICKAAQPMEKNEQLDFIQARLAPKLGIKPKVVSPHISLFLKDFEEVVAQVGKPEVTESEYWEKVHTRISERLLHDPTSIGAFYKAIQTFVDKTENLYSQRTSKKEAAKYEDGLTLRLQLKSLLSHGSRRESGKLLEPLTDGAEESAIPTASVSDALDEQLHAAKAKADAVGQGFENAAQLVEEMLGALDTRDQVIAEYQASRDRLTRESEVIRSKYAASLRV